MSPEKFSSDWNGRLIDGQFALLRCLGETGSGSVFLTEFGDPPEPAAIKLIPADTADSDAILAQWKAATHLSHPHLLRLFHAGHSSIDGQDVLYAVTEHSEEILSEILPARPLTPAEVREMLDPVLAALSWLHAQKLVHGGLKPSNIMAVNDRLKLSADRIQAAGPRLIKLASLDIHDAPESAESVTPQADVWSVGVLLVEAFTQRPPQWDRTSAAEPSFPASVPEPFAAIVRQCLHLDPARRCSLAEIKSLLAPSAAPAPAPVPPVLSPFRAPVAAVEPPARIPAQPSVHIEPKLSTNRRARLVILVVLLLIAAVVGVIVATHRSAPSSSQPPQFPAATKPRAPTSGAAAGPTIPGEVAHRTLPDVPRSAANTIRGHVRVSVRVQVDANGNVSSADFESPGPSRYFANLALNAARNWKFRPAQASGRPVPSTWLLHFAFGPTGVDVTPVENAP